MMSWARGSDQRGGGGVGEEGGRAGRVVRGLETQEPRGISPLDVSQDGRSTQGGAAEIGEGGRAEGDEVREEEERAAGL